jgi:shikimate 5-dehydrogenase
MTNKELSDLDLAVGRIGAAVETAQTQLRGVRLHLGLEDTTLTDPLKNTLARLSDELVPEARVILSRLFNPRPGVEQEAE